jgi:predicted DNA binding CopG/RHH family protein
MTHAEHEQPRPKRAKNRIPRFKSVEEEAAFWDTHDLTEFEDELEVVTDVRFVKAGARGAKKAITVRLEEDTLEALTQAAREKGVGSSTLVRMWIREHLGKSGGRVSSAPGA